MTYQLPPEWHPQDAVMLTWPHAATDWAPHLSEVEPTYIAIAQEVTKRQALLVICHDSTLEQHVRRILNDAGIDIGNLFTVVIPCNDTWARDHGPLTVIDSQGELVALDFRFNGWGGKYESTLDNAITHQLLEQDKVAASHKKVDLVLEGGGIEVDGEGHLLTTERCLLNVNRNPYLNRQQIEAQLKTALGVDTVFWLQHGVLEGDDTDAHIDTLARFAPNKTIVYAQCDDPNDSHYEELNDMQAELEQLRGRDGQPFRLIPLPWPRVCYNNDGDRLPATYANFLVINGAVLVPTYRQPERDTNAKAQIQHAFPEHEILGIDCLPLINQFGSLHCISMQLPKGFLA